MSRFLHENKNILAAALLGTLASITEATYQRLIPAGEQSGLSTHIATTENGLLSGRMKS